MQNIKYKTIMCKFFTQCKPCPLGTRCHFAHGKNELRKMGDKLPNNIPYQTGSRMNLGTTNAENQPEQNVGMHNYKTVICKYWEQGKCKYQQKCSFAHGDPEIRNPENNYLEPTNTMIDPLRNTAFEYFLRSQQLHRIAEQLQIRYNTDQEKKLLIDSSLQALQNWKINLAAENLMKIIFNVNLSEEEKQQNQQLVQESCEFAEKFLNFCKGEEFQKMFKYFQEHQTKEQNWIIKNQNFQQIVPNQQEETTQ